MIRVPDDAKVTLGTQPMGWTVAIARKGATSDLAAAMAKTGLCVVLTHDAGTNWTDETGEAIANTTLACPATAIFMVFETLADALACRQRLEAGNA